jgi:hypothetical protein
MRSECHLHIASLNGQEGRQTYERMERLRSKIFNVFMYNIASFPDSLTLNYDSLRYALDGIVQVIENKIIV